MLKISPAAYPRATCYPDPVDGKVKRIMIVDDHPVVREGLRGILSTEDGFEVCGVAADGGEARVLAEETSPDLALVDISLPDVSGLELVVEFVESHPGVYILVSSMHDETIFAERALNAGARGYVSKHEEASVLVEAVHTVLKGDIYLSSRMQQRILQRARSTRTGRSRQSSRFAALTARELEIFTLLGEGETPQVISTRLGISVKTVHTHRENIKEKLAIDSSAKLLRCAFEYQFEQRGASNVDEGPPSESSSQ